MKQMIIDLFNQLGMAITHQNIDGVLLVYTNKSYIHYDEIKPFTKLNIFKGISVDIKGNIVIQFITS